jgi:hypothetical protein
MLVLVKLEDLLKLRKIFLSLDHCALDLGDPYNLPDQEATLKYLDTFKDPSLLAPIRAIQWNFKGEDFHHLVRQHAERSRKYPPFDYSKLPEDDYLNELDLLHQYHTHVLRVILGRFSAAEYVEVPSSMLFVLLGRINDHLPQYRLQELQDNLRLLDVVDQGDSILSIIQNAKYVRFVGPSHPFWNPNWSKGTTTISDGELKLSATFTRAIRQCTLPENFRGPSHGISLSCNIGARDCQDEDRRWLEFLQQFRTNGGITKIIHICEPTRTVLPYSSMCTM